MKRSIHVVSIWIIIVISTVTLHGDIQHGVDPRGKIENIVEEGEFVWEMDEKKFTGFVKEAGETGKDFTVREIKWIVTGGDQDWSFTRITRMGDYNALTIKRERFWIALRRVDGVWVTRLKYRYRDGEYKAGDTDEVKEKDKGGKYTANCRVSGKQIVLALYRKKKGHVFRITKEDGFMRVDHMTTHDCGAWAMSYRKQGDDHRSARVMRIKAETQGATWLYMDGKTGTGNYYREVSGDSTGSGWKLVKDETGSIKPEHKEGILR